MQKVIFCNIAYMKNYCGAKNDTPVNGGKYITENNDGGEVYNFLDYNGKCYGYFMHYGDKLSIERIDIDADKENYVDDVCVIWVAKKSSDSSNVIVGWYKNARVYRYVKNDFSCETLGYYPEPDKDLYYNIVADAKDCYLLPENMRNYIIPRASKIGKGKGMGQSAIWYADSEYARKEVVPSVLAYISKCEEENCGFINTVYTDALLSEEYTGNKSVDELTELAKDINTPTQEALRYVNAALKTETNADLLFIKADILMEYFCFDKALECYEKSYEIEKDINLLVKMYWVYILTHQYEKAVITAETLESDDTFNDWSDDDKYELYMTVFKCLGVMKKVSKAQTYLAKLKNICSEEELDYIDDMINLYN